MIDLEKLAESHKALFPNATLESQVWKLEEEIKELDNAKSYDERLKERADIQIVCGGLYRWLPVLAESLSDYFWWNGVDEEVNRKWQINLKRKWEWNGKTYHHIGEDK